jgi:diphosphate-dependent phosphofructokinase
MILDYTPVAEALKNLKPEIPPQLKEIKSLCFEKKGRAHLNPEISKLFPRFQKTPYLYLKKGEARELKALNVGVVFSGGQASGGHNVLSGIYQTLIKGNPECRLFGFLGGPKGIIEGHYVELDHEAIEAHHNQGGFDLIGSGRNKIEKEEELQSALQICKTLDLDGLVIVGGDDSNTNAALLAHYFLEHQCKTVVVGVPKTIDGDLKNEWVEQSFGFDTACRTYSEMIGNLSRDCLSAKKYSHFVRLMGRSASHIALECALQTHPNGVLIGEEVAQEKWSLEQCVRYFEEIINARADQGKYYGIYLIPEGLIEFIPEMRTLIQELNQLLGEGKQVPASHLSEKSKKVFDFMPNETKEQLLLERDPHGNVQVSHIETEKLFITLLKERLNVKFSPISHFFGYEGRSGYPSFFDATYCYTLGKIAAGLCFHKMTGYMAAVQNLSGKIANWQPCALPIASLLHLEERKGKLKPVIAKALVDLSATPFHYFQQMRKGWENDEAYRFPGPIQFFGPQDVTHQCSLTLQLEKAKDLEFLLKN